MSENGKAGSNAPFDEDINVRVIYMTGGILAAVTILVYLLVMGLLSFYGKRDIARGQTKNPLLKADSDRRLQQRVESIPGPTLEGLQPEENKVLMHTPRGEEWFYIPSSTYIRIDDKGAQLYDLREGTQAEVNYWERDKRHVATTIVVPPPPTKHPVSHKEKGLSFVIGKILKIEPLTIRGWREWAAVRKGRYGWTDRDKKIVHIPVERAYQGVLDSKEVRDAGKGKEPAPWLDRPTSSSSGRGAKEERQ